MAEDEPLTAFMDPKPLAAPEKDIAEALPRSPADAPDELSAATWGCRLKLPSPELAMDFLRS